MESADLAASYVRYEHDHARWVDMYGLCTVCAVDVARAALGDAGPPQPGPAGWRGRARRAIRELVASRDEFTADDVWLLIPRPGDPRALGPLLLEAAEEGLIVRTDRTVVSGGPFNHSRPVRVWEVAQRRLV